MKTVHVVMAILVAALLYWAVVSGAQPMSSTQSLSEEDQVRHAVESLYVKGLATRDSGLIRTICVPGTKLMGTTEGGTLNVTDLDQWSARFDPDNPPFQTIDYCVSKIDVAGTAAQVKIVFIVDSTTTVTDFLNMLKLQGEWRIVNIIDY